MRPPVDIHYRRNACRVTARRKADGTISVTVPYGLDPLEQSTIIDKLVDRINSQPQKPRLLIADNTRIEAPGITFTFSVDPHVPPSGIAARLHGSGIPFEASVAIGRDVDLTNGSTQKRLSDIAVRLAAMAGEPLILQPAREISSRLGIHPSRWEIGRGRRTLGTCRTDRSISLSALLAFLPQELKEFIICHELAHLTEMNHSQRFHQLCDSYLGGREATLSQTLKSYRWPILR